MNGLKIGLKRLKRLKNLVMETLNKIFSLIVTHPLLSMGVFIACYGGLIAIIERFSNKFLKEMEDERKQ